MVSAAHGVLPVCLLPVLLFLFSNNEENPPTHTGTKKKKNRSCNFYFRKSNIHRKTNQININSKDTAVITAFLYGLEYVFSSIEKLYNFFQVILMNLWLWASPEFAASTVLLSFLLNEKNFSLLSLVKHHS